MVEAHGGCSVIELLYIYIYTHIHMCVCVLGFVLLSTTHSRCMRHCCIVPYTSALLAPLSFELSLSLWVPHQAIVAWETSGDGGRYMN